MTVARGVPLGRSNEPSGHGPDAVQPCYQGGWPEEERPSGWPRPVSLWMTCR
jgi:hypothetical protein